MTAPYTPIACEWHDYLEVACLRRYPLLIELDDGTRLEAQALDTETTATKEEFLIVAVDGARRPLRLDRIHALTPLAAEATFGRMVLAAR